MSEALTETEGDAATVAKRFAPRLVVNQELPDPGELTLIWRVIGDAALVIRRCLAIAIALIWQRALHWVETRILRSLPAAWSIGSIGWGGFFLLSIVELLR